MANTAEAVAITTELFERTRAKYLAARLNQEEERDAEEQRKREQKDAEQGVLQRAQEIVDAQITNLERYGVRLTPDQMEAIRVTALEEARMEQKAASHEDPPKIPATTNDPFTTVLRHRPGLPGTPRQEGAEERKSPLPKDERDTSRHHNKEECHHRADCSFWGIGGCGFDQTNADKITITRRLNTCVEKHIFDNQQQYQVTRAQARLGSSRLLENQRAIDAPHDSDALPLLYPVADIMEKDAKKHKQTYKQYDTAVKAVTSPVGLQSKEQHLLNALRRFSNPRPTSSAAPRPNNRQNQGRGGFHQRPPSRERLGQRAASPKSPNKRHRRDDDGGDNEHGKPAASRTETRTDTRANANGCTIATNGQPRTIGWHYEPDTNTNMNQERQTQAEMARASLTKTDTRPATTTSQHGPSNTSYRRP
jgi:hypothetical protein